MKVKLIECSRFGLLCRNRLSRRRARILYDISDRKDKAIVVESLFILGNFSWMPLLAR